MDTEGSGVSRRKTRAMKIKRKRIKATNQVIFSVLRFSLPVIWKLGGRTDLILFIAFNILEKVFAQLTPFALKYVVNNVTSDSYPLVIGSLSIDNFYTLTTLFVLTMFLALVFNNLTGYYRIKAV